MEYPELSLGLSNTHLASKRTIEANNPSKKRKLQGNNLNLVMEEASSSFMAEAITTVDEKSQTFHSDYWKQQCHDLQSGRMYSLNRNTMKKKSCSYCQKAPNLDLELNFSSSEGRRRSSDDLKIQQSSASNNSDNMVAMGCFKCNQLVMLSKSFPSCPNCKYVHSLPTDRQSQPRKSVKPVGTLSLLN